MFAVWPWHEAIKEPGAFAMVTFEVGETDGKNTPGPEGSAPDRQPPEGKYPKGEAHMVILDFLVSGCALADHTVPNSVPRPVPDRPFSRRRPSKKPSPVWPQDLPVGKHAFIVGLTRGRKADRRTVQSLPRSLRDLRGAGGNRALTMFPTSIAYESAGTRPCAVSPPLVLAPMAGITDMTYRLLLRRLGGVGLVTMEFVSSEGLTRGNWRTERLLRFDPDERPLSVQIYGADAARDGPGRRARRGDAGRRLRHQHGLPGEHPRASG